MSEKLLPPPELAIPDEDWAQTPARVRVILLALHQQVQVQQWQQERLQKLEVEVANLREQVKRNSGNSSQPPSRDTPAQKKPIAKDKMKKQRGGQCGHKGHQRKVVSIKEVDVIKVCKPTECAACGRLLNGDDPEPYRYQVVELPPIKAHITEYQVHRLDCPECGAMNRGTLPPEVASSQFGVNLTGLIAILMGVFRLSKRKVVLLLETCYGITLSPGSVVRAQTSVSAAVAEAVEEARSAVQNHAARYIDETSWPQGDQTRRGYLGVVVTPLVCVFHIVMSRASQVARDLLGEDSIRPTVSDRAGCYSWLRERVWQVCWAHLLRDFQKIMERGGASGQIGENLRCLGDAMLKRWARVRDGTLTQADFLAELPAFQASVHAWLTQGAGCDHPKTVETCRRLLAVEAALWTFATYPEVEPTNNTAERALRHAVIWRKTSYGTQSEGGSRFVERILTVVATCHQQGQNPLSFVRQSLYAQRVGLPAPSLLPQTYQEY